MGEVVHAQPHRTVGAVGRELEPEHLRAERAPIVGRGGGEADGREVVDHSAISTGVPPMRMAPTVREKLSVARNAWPRPPCTSW